MGTGEDVEEFRAIRPQGSSAKIERPETHEKTAERRIHHRVEFALEIHVRGLRAGSGESAAEDYARQRGGERLPVALVAPIGDEKARCAVQPPGFLRRRHVLAHVFHPPGERTPRRRAGADVELEPRLCEHLRLALEWMVRLVAPIESYHVFRQAFYHVRMLENDVAPEHRTLAAPPRRVGDFQQKRQIFLRVVHFERLVATYVRERRTEVRQKLAKQTVDEGKRLRVGRIEGRRMLLYRLPGRHYVAARVLCQRIVSRQGEPPLHVPERVLVGHELQTLHFAVGVEFAHFGGGHRVCFFPDVFVGAVRESVFHVQLELVVAVPCENVDDEPQRAHGRHAVAAYVEHETSCFEHGGQALGWDLANSSLRRSTETWV